jgi:membrane-associated protease RseP (regulator of RpoE activity)
MRGSDAPADAPADGPAPTEIGSVFQVYDLRRDGDTLLYVGEPTVDSDTLERRLWPLFREHGFEVSLEEGYRPTDGHRLSRAEYVLVARPRSVAVEGVPWRNLALFVATVLSTLFAGAVFWYHIPVTEDPLRALEAWPFSAAILGVMGIHEMGHYAMSRYHDVEATLPFFIPQPLVIGSMGAVIRMKGRIPSRKALFDIGVAGPLAGLAATIVVAIVGLHLDPLPAQVAAADASNGAGIKFNNPPLMSILAELTGQTARLQADAPVHPVFFGAWVGMFMTFLNMLPVGQFDGGHVLRALVGPRQETVAAAVPGALFALAIYLAVTRNGMDSVFIWLLWGVFTVAMAYAGPATPIDDESLDRRRLAVGVVTLVLGALCFTAIPVEVVTPG